VGIADGHGSSQVDKGQQQPPEPYYNNYIGLYHEPSPWESQLQQLEHILFVVKMHAGGCNRVVQQEQAKGRLVVFTSRMVVDRLSSSTSDTCHDLSLYEQTKVHLIQCPACQVEQYRSIFGLSDQDVEILNQYMHAYGQLRQCCGLQMSKYERMRLNGCNMTMHLSKKDYPHCETLDLPAMEVVLATSPIPRQVHVGSSFNWEQPGDCAKYKAMIQTKHLCFNGSPFEGCQDPVERS